MTKTLTKSLWGNFQDKHLGMQTIYVHMPYKRILKKTSIFILLLLLWTIILGRPQQFNWCSFEANVLFAAAAETCLLKVPFYEKSVNTIE